MDAQQSAQVIPFRRRPPDGFSSAELVELAGWGGSGRRLELEAAVEGQFNFALIYQDQTPWASWGLGRDGADILVWDCITHADIGRFGTLGAALAAVPAGRDRGRAAPVRTSAEVIPLHGVALAS